MANWQVTYYRTASGRVPVMEFLDRLSDKEAARVLSAITDLQRNGTALREPHAKKMSGSSLWELRIRGRIQIRIFYVAADSGTFILLHGFIKKSQQTPKKEIRTAERRFREYRRR